MSHDPTEPLRELLHDIAAQAEPVDLRDRVHARSRRDRRRHALASGALAVLVVAATAMGLTQAAGVHPPVTDDPPVGSSAPVPPSGAPSRSSAPPSASASASGPAQPDPGGAIGTLFYLDQPNGGTVVVPATVHRWDSSGSTVTSVFRLTNTADAANVSVSPNGRWLSWVNVIGPDAPTLRLADLGSGAERTLLVGVEPFFSEPSWTPDSSRLLLRRMTTTVDGDGVGTVDVASGTFTPLTSDFYGVHPTLAADGSGVVYSQHVGAGSDEVLKVTDPTGKELRTVPNQAPSGYDICSVSAGSTHVAVRRRTSGGPITDGNPGGLSLDIARLLYCNTIVDTRTGAALTLPALGELLQVKFRADGSLLARVRQNGQHRLVLLSRDLEVLTERPEPASLKNFMLL
jgi:TolB protein